MSALFGNQSSVFLTGASDKLTKNRNLLFGRAVDDNTEEQRPQPQKKTLKAVEYRQNTPVSRRSILGG